MKWKLSVGVSSSACRSLNSPYITALVTVTDPSGALLTKSFEMTIGEFKVRDRSRVNSHSTGNLLRFRPYEQRECEIRLANVLQRLV